MDIRVLKYFLAVAREQSFSVAAERLYLSQPTLSRQMMELEDELGASLFARGRRRIALTEEGRFLEQRAEEMVALAERTLAEFRDPEDGVSGEVAIGGGETDAMRFVARAAVRVREASPQVTFRLFSGNDLQFESCIGKPIPERILSRVFHITVGPSLHGIIGEIRQLCQILIECHGQLPARFGFSEQDLRKSASSAGSGIPQDHYGVKMLCRIGKIDVAPRRQAKDHGFSRPGDGFHQLTLYFRQLQGFLVTGRIAVAGISFFSFQSLVQTDAKNDQITVFRNGHRLCQPVLYLSQRFGTVTEKITPHCSKDPDLIAQIILQSLLESDIP